MQVVYGARLIFSEHARLGNSPDDGFTDDAIGDGFFSTYDINQAHRFIEWMNEGQKHHSLNAIVEERAPYEV